MNRTSPPAAVLLSCVVALAVVVATGPPAGAQETGAQETGDERAVRVRYETGDFDADRGDWAITVVHVTGEMEPGLDFTVELLDDDGNVLWSGSEAFAAPTTSLTVASFVAVGDVAGTAVSQSLPEVAGDVTARAPAEVLSQGSGGGGGGTLALSMVLAVVLVAIVFRTPLPAASSQRWTR